MGLGSLQMILASATFCGCTLAEEECIVGFVMRELGGEQPAHSKQGALNGLIFAIVFFIG